jgi:putative transposase
MIYKNDYTLPKQYLKRLRQKIKRRKRVVRVFPNEQLCLRLISTILVEVSEEWEYDRLFLKLESS